MTFRSQALGHRAVRTPSALRHASLGLQRGLDYKDRGGLEEVFSALGGEPDHTGKSTVGGAPRQNHGNTISSTQESTKDGLKLDQGLGCLGGSVG